MLQELQRIFLGEIDPLFWLEVAFRTAFLYLFMIGMLRVIGHRAIENLSAFDFAIVIAMGSAAGDPMFYPEIPLIHGMIVITVILFVERGLAKITRVSTKAEDVIEGKTEEVVRHGILNTKYMEKSNISHEEVFMKLRKAGARNLSQVEYCYLELDGNYSVLLFADDKKRTGLSIVPAWDIEEPTCYDAGQPVPANGEYACIKCGTVGSFKKGDLFPTCQCGASEWTQAVESR